jgi:hypothetical protein
MKTKSKFIGLLAMALVGAGMFSACLRAAETNPRSSADRDSYNLAVRLDVAKGELAGTLVLDYRNNGINPLDEIRLRLDPNLNRSFKMEIDSIQDATGQPFPWRFVRLAFGALSSERGQVAIQLPKPLPTGETIRLNLAFRESGPFIGNEMTTLQDDPYHSFDAWYPKAMTRIDNDWSIDDDRPSDFTVAVTLPANHTVASTGVPAGEQPSSGGDKTLRLRAEGVRGFTIYASSAWKKFHATAGDIDLEVCLPSEAEKWATPILETMASVIRFYEQHYGQFPSRHLAMICPGDLTGRLTGAPRPATSLRSG